MVKRTSSELATPTETGWTLLKKSRDSDRDNRHHLRSSRRHGKGIDDVFRKLPGQSTIGYPLTLKNAVTADDDTDPSTKHDSPPQLELKMRLNAPSNPFLYSLRQDSSTFDSEVAVLRRNLPRLVAVEEFDAGFVTPKLSPASTLPLSPPPLPTHRGGGSEKDVIPIGLPAELLFPVLP